MKRFRPQVLISLALAVLVSACSQAPEGVGGLEAQFGTPAHDVAVDVALQKGLGNVYVAGYSGNRAFIRQYKRDGSLAWERLSAVRTGLFANALATDVDANKNVYLAWVYYRDGSNPNSYNLAAGPFISKFDQTGKLLWRKPFANLISMDIDAKGNLYLVGTNSVRKHNLAGSLVWERTPSNYEADMVDVVVAASGNVVASSKNGMIVKYTNGGTRLFRTTRNFGVKGVDALALGPNEVIAATASIGVSEDTATKKILKVFQPDGTLAWETSMYDDTSYYTDNYDSHAYSAITAGIAFDERKNVYYTAGHWACESGVTLAEEDGGGALCERGADSDPSRSAILVQKYAPDGAPVWSRVFNKDRSGLDFSTDIVAFSENELYLAGTTVNEINGQNAGGLDALLMRLDGQGKSVWLR